MEDQLSEVEAGCVTDSMGKAEDMDGKDQIDATVWLQWSMD